MKIYVWRGERVLRNYRSGMAVVAATDQNEAWEKLRDSYLCAYLNLLYGVSYHTWSPEDLNEDDFPDYWEPILPEEYDIENFPVLVIPGGE